MKNSFILLLSLLAMNAFAITEVDVISSEFGVLDNNNEQTLCLTIVRVPETDSRLGLVEDIYDCYYARMAKTNSQLKIDLDLDKLNSIEHAELRDHLQKLDPELEFYFSDGE